MPASSLFSKRHIFYYISFNFDMRNNRYERHMMSIIFHEHVKFYKLEVVRIETFLTEIHCSSIAHCANRHNDTSPICIAISL